MSKQTKARKTAHVNICLKKRVEASEAAGFEAIRFTHYALPELDFKEIDLKTVFLGKKLFAPFMINAITGGYAGAEKINKDLARACEQEGIAFGLGSQRAMIEDTRLARTFKVRDVAPNIFLAGNIGATQLKEIPLAKIEAALEAVEANALCIHLNPLQSIVQKDGDLNWRNCLRALEKACEKLRVPVIAKEVGCGVNAQTARELEQAGVAAIDVAGLGGTSWSAVELYRGGSEGKTFWNWGIPTIESLKQCVGAVKIPLIASGGVRSGLDAAKAIRLGASLAGAALPFLKAQNKGGALGVRNEISRWKNELKTAMFLTRSKNLTQLRQAQLL